MKMTLFDLSRIMQRQVEKIEALANNTGTLEKTVVVRNARDQAVDTMERLKATWSMIILTTTVDVPDDLARAAGLQMTKPIAEDAE